MVYEWKITGVCKVDANIAGAVCEELKNTVGLTKENLVNASRPENAPLHDEFEWDDEIAAEEYRKEQAGRILRLLVVKDESLNNQPVRAYFPVNITEGKAKGYDDIRTIMLEKEKRSTLLDTALKELSYFKLKYSMLQELSEVFEAIDNLEIK